MTGGWRSAVLLLGLWLGTGFGVPARPARAAEPGSEAPAAAPIAEDLLPAAAEEVLAEALEPAASDDPQRPVAGASQESFGGIPEQGSFEAAAAPQREFRGAIEQAWFAPAASLEERVWRTRRNALERGVWSLDAAARVLFAPGGVPLERAEAAVRLAPDLPAGRMELAEALWLRGDSPLAAVRTATSALAAFGRHLEASLWLGGSVLTVLAAGLVGGGILCIAVLGLFMAPHAAHDLADLFSRSMPAFARGALLASLLLLPAVLGEGLLGLSLGLLAVGVAYGRGAQRVALGLASVSVLLGAYPVARLAGATLEALPADPVARAVLASGGSVALPVDQARLEAAGESDLLAKQALARLARRVGNLGQADAMYQALLERMPDDPVVVNNAANVRLRLGHMESALSLYHQALEIEESPIVLFNLSQAYGRAFQVDDLTTMLERAQALDGGLVADLTRLQGAQPEGFVVDLPLQASMLWRRVFDAGRGTGFAAEFRRPLAPGRLGASDVVTASALFAVIAGGCLLGSRLRASRWCARCGRRVCPRCHPEVSGGELCSACNRLFYQPEQTDRGLRLARIEALRVREARLDRIAWAASLAIPGAAGALARRPLCSLLGAFFFAIAVGALVWRGGVVPDPLVAGAAGPFAFLCIAILAGIGYAIVVGASLAARRAL